MSRIGKKFIEIPQNVLIKILDNKIVIEGKNGVLEQEFLNLVTFNLLGNKLFVSRMNDHKNTKAYHGLMRALVCNMVKGVNDYFSKIIIAEGIGYKFSINNNLLTISAGYTDLVNLKIFADLKVKLESPTKIIISGINKERVGSFAALVRNVRKPDPYKAKGFHFEGEVVRRKIGKKAK